MFAFKESGLTMNQFITDVKNKLNLAKIAYTARLDPMARGIVPILVNDECLKIKQSLGSNKTYHVRVFLGIQTDTDDTLGIIKKMSLDYDFYNFIDNHKKEFELDDYSYEQKFHYFSTKSMKHRKQKDFTEKYHKITIYSSKISCIGKINYDHWKNANRNIISKIDKNKNFRQNEILEQWDNLEIEELNYLDLELKVSSGFFVRQFIRDISTKINFPLMCYDIYRVSID